MKVTSKIEVDEFDGVPYEGNETKFIKVSSHGNWHNRVVLTVDGHTYTLISHELEKAIHNATNY